MTRAVLAEQSLYNALRTTRPFSLCLADSRRDEFDLFKKTDEELKFYLIYLVI